MNLSVPERLLLSYVVLPAEDERAVMKIARALRDELSFSEQEWEDFKLVQNGSDWQWDTETIVDKDVPIGLKVSEVIMAGFETLNGNKKVSDPVLALWERFEEEGD